MTEALVAASQETGTALVVDLPPEQSLAASGALSARGLLIVPIVQRWVSSSAVIPCSALVAALARGAAEVQLPKACRGVALLLDGERAGPPERIARRRGARAFDNRYHYSPDRFPSPSFLQRQGLRRVRWIAPGIAADLRSYAADLAAAGLAPELAPCSSSARPATPASQPPPSGPQLGAEGR